MGLLYGLLVIGVSFSLMSCSGGGGGGGRGGASSGARGTGFLKIDLPTLPEATLVSGSGLGAKALVIDAGTYANPILTFNSAVENKNTEDACVGSTANIPFIVCMIESLGINRVGEYRGQSPRGDNVEVEVIELTGDPDGYVLQAKASLLSSGDAIFLYRANADGTKGLIEVIPVKIFNMNDYGETGYRVRWDKTTAPLGSLEFTAHWISDDTVGVSLDLYHLRALIDESTSVADLASRAYKFFDSGLAEGESQFQQTRLGAGRVMALMTNCSDTMTPTEGNECFAAGTTAVHDLSGVGEPLLCGEINSSNELQSISRLSLSNTTMGSLSLSGNFADVSCEALKNATNGGDAFSIHLDKNSASGATLSGIFHDLRAETYSSLSLLTNGSFLQ